MLVSSAAASASHNRPLVPCGSSTAQHTEAQHGMHQATQAALLPAACCPGEVRTALRLHMDLRVAGHAANTIIGLSNRREKRALPKLATPSAPQQHSAPRFRQSVSASLRQVKQLPSSPPITPSSSTGSSSNMSKASCRGPPTQQHQHMCGVETCLQPGNPTLPFCASYMTGLPVTPAPICGSKSQACRSHWSPLYTLTKHNSPASHTHSALSLNNTGLPVTPVPL